MILENIVGTLRDAYALVNPETMQHSDELEVERLTDPSLRDVGFYTADGNIYDMHERMARLSMTRRDHNLVLRHIDDACRELTSSGNYHPNKEEALAAIAAKSTISIELAQLHLQGEDREWGSLAIPTHGYDTLAPEERKLAERVHGSGDTFPQVMKMLSDAGIRETRIYILNPSYVEENTREGSIVRVSWLNDFDNSASFSANDRYINLIGRLRGVRRRVASVNGGQ